MAQVDVFAFGLVVLELTTMKRLDHYNSTCWPELLESVKDDVCSCRASSVPAAPWTISASSC